MTLHDFEWLERINVHYYELHLRVIIYLCTVEFVYTRDQRRCAEAELRTVIRIIFGIHGKTADHSQTLHRRNLNK